MERLKVGVTGASGFIGRHLVTALEKLKSVDFACFDGDLLNITDVEKYLENNPNISQIIHLAGSFAGDFNTLVASNVVTTNNLLEVATKNKVNKIIFASTGAVYGEPLNNKSKEDDPLNPVTEYGLTKMFAEETIKYYARNREIKYIILRFPNVYGPRNNKGVIYSFTKAIRETGTIEVLGDGNQERNFLYVADAVDSLTKTLDYNSCNDIINIATPELYSLNDLISAIRMFVPVFTTTYKTKDQTNALKTLSLDISKVGRVLGWTPEVSLIEGLKKTTII